MRIKRPPRIPEFDYRGPNRYLLTTCVNDRQCLFCDDEHTHRICTQLLQFADAAGFDVTAYCFMPDHVHALLEGLRPDSDLRSLVHRWKQRTGFDWKRRTGACLWQEGYFDRVLREEDDPLAVVSYIANNPVRAGLVDSPEEYPLFGSARYSIREILEAVTDWHPYARRPRESDD